MCFVPIIIPSSAPLSAEEKARIREDFIALQVLYFVERPVMPSAIMEYKVSFFPQL